MTSWASQEGCSRVCWAGERRGILDIGFALGVLHEEPWDAVAYALMYQFALAAGIGHSEAARAATLAARAGERDPEGFARIARAIRKLEGE